MLKIRWSDEERRLLLKEVQRQHFIHPTMRTLDLVRMSQNIVFKADRRRDLKGNDHVIWVQKERDDWIIEAGPKRFEKRAQLEPQGLRKEEQGPQPPSAEEFPKQTATQPDWKFALVEFLSDAMVQVVAEAIVRAREKLDLPIVQQPAEIVKSSNYAAAPIKHVCTKPLKKIAVYGLFSNQEQVVRNAVKGCFEFRFLKDVSQNKLTAGAQWADVMFIMTKFVSHDYEAIKRFGNIRYINGASSALIAELENLYLAEQK